MLRQRLLEITKFDALEVHAAKIEELRGATGHSIVARASEHPLALYTCAVHAFDLVEDPTYVDVAASGTGCTFAGPEFITFLLENELLASRSGSMVAPGDLVMYFANEVFTHVGRMLSISRVLSKWGIGGLYEHEVWEVPSNYGTRVRHFVGPDKDASFELFLRYAESKGLKFGIPDA